MLVQLRNLLKLVAKKVPLRDGTDGSTNLKSGSFLMDGYRACLYSRSLATFELLNVPCPVTQGYVTTRKLTSGKWTLHGGHWKCALVQKRVYWNPMVLHRLNPHQLLYRYVVGNSEEKLAIKCIDWAKEVGRSGFKLELDINTKSNASSPRGHFNCGPLNWTDQIEVGWSLVASQFPNP